MSDSPKAFTVRIPHAQREKIRRIEDRSGRTAADIVRDAIDQLADAAHDPAPGREDSQAAGG